MVGRSNSGGKPLAERLAELTKEDIESSSSENDKPLTERMALFTQTIATTCRALGYTPEAAQQARN